LLAIISIFELQPSILQDICIYLQHVGAGIFHSACSLQAGVGCWLLSVSCGFLFVIAILVAVAVFFVAVVFVVVM
jgi:hypothetical protein